MLINNINIRGIFKYSEDVKFEKDDFVVDGNCIYICTSEVIGVQPSLDTEHLYYSEYPGDKIISASEYYDYVRNTERGLQVDDKYVSAQSLCEILENMYFGFGDNGIIYDHVIYNPDEGIEYSIRGAKEHLDYSSKNVLDKIIRDNDLNNGFIKISRNLPEVRDLIMDDSFDSDVVVLKQYTYLDSSDSIPYRVQELMDPEKNRIYFRFAKGQILENEQYDFSDTIVSKWKNLYNNDEDVLDKLNSLEDYYQRRLQEEADRVNRISGKYCYREVVPSDSNYLGHGIVYLEPGESRDIKSITGFDKPCILNILIKTQISFDPQIFKNYTLTIDSSDTYNSQNNSETYNIADNLTVTTIFDNSLAVQRLILQASSGVIKDVYYRDYTMEHMHNYISQGQTVPPTCTEYGSESLICTLCGNTITQPVNPLGHDMDHHEYKAPNCIEPGNWEYWYCRRCHIYFKDRDGLIPPFSGVDKTIIPALGGDHNLGDWVTITEPTCTVEGQRGRYCSVCSQLIYTEPIEALGHDWSDWVITVQPDCGNPGLKERTCLRCNAVDTEPIDQLQHNMEPHEASEVSCGEPGLKEYWHCTNCGQDFLDPNGEEKVINSSDLITPPTGKHYFGTDIESKTYTLVESTYTDETAIGVVNLDNPKPVHGIGLRTCLVCGNKVEEKLPFKQHEFSNEFSYEYDGSAVYRNGLHYPSYTQGYCQECGDIRRNYEFRNDIDVEKQLVNHVVDHTSGNYNPPTCGQYGFWKGTCLLCGQHDAIEYRWDAPPTGHRLSGETTWIPNTCTDPASFVGECSICNQPVQTIDGEHGAIGHRDVNPKNDICDACGKSLVNGFGQPD